MSLVFLVLVVVTAISPSVSHKNIERGIFHSAGLDLFIIMCFLLAAAGLGACFSNLFTAQNFVSNGKFDPKYDATYWSKLVLGLTSGLIMAEMLPIDWSQVDSMLGKPTTALLGGFAAPVVHRILQRLVESLETLVQGSAKNVLDSRLASERMEQERLLMQSKMEIAQSLMQMGDAMGEDLRPEIRQSINGYASQLVQAGELRPTIQRIGSERTQSNTTSSVTQGAA